MEMKLLKYIYKLFFLILMQFHFSCTCDNHDYNILFITVDDLNDWVGFMDEFSRYDRGHNECS